MTNISREDFDALLRRSGLSLSAGRVEEIHEAWELIEPMLERVRDSGRGGLDACGLMFNAVDCSKNSDLREEI